ncbi:MAG: phage tail sheath family protein [Anaerolineaceae bacterium]|nr:phage tail sheath family protein [Anaerolineaceae bacterium]MCB9100298.1 phage tail sheath family protein [Anaerolineales bacterium]
MPEYLSPGVYVEEIDRGPRPIEGVGTAMAAFVGFTEKAQMVEQIDGEWITQDLLNQPQLVTNWSQYVERFGEFVEGAYLPQAVYGYFMNGGGRCYVLSVRTIPRATATLLNSDGKPQLLAQAKQAGFDGLRLRVKIETQNGTSAPASTSSSASSKKSTTDKTDDKKDDGKEASSTPASSASASSNDQSFTLIVERETSTGSWQQHETLRDVKLVEVEEEGQKQVKVAYQNNRGSRWINLVVPETRTPLAKLWPREQQQSLQIESAQLPAPAYDEFQGEVTDRTGMEGLQAIEEITMVCVPDLMTTMPGEKLDLDLVKAVQTLMIAHCEQMGDRVAILDSPPNMKPQQINKWRMDTAGYDSSYAALYYPWIQVQDPIQNKPILIPPCGHMAGIWARNDNTRGVHKAPANEVVLGATGLAYNTTKGEQDVLNPNAVNCIRAFPGRGIRVWGARTLSSNPSWRYINVRRLFNFVEKSIERGTQWVVFEPNDRALWARVRRDVTAFLRTVWADGALFGNNPGEAFYVKCDDELNPPESRDLGRLIVEIGLCPVKPAEFVIFRISQWAGPNAEV